MNCFYLGIDDSATETSYVYTSDNSHLVSTIESTIVVGNGCGPQKECDHLYTCDHITQINTIWSDYQLVDLVCVNVRTPEGMFSNFSCMFLNLNNFSQFES